MRKHLNEILISFTEAKLFQRGKIFTWTRKDKIEIVKENNIGIIVNFWPKVDPDFNENEDLDWYLFIPVAKSIDMSSYSVYLASKVIAEYLKMQDKSVLVLCEAGKTRSVYFCVLVLNQLGHTLDESLRRVEKEIPFHCLKDWMLDYIEENRK